MRLPLFQKIEIQSTDIEEISAILKKNNVSACPTILLFDHLDKTPVIQAIQACKKAFESNEINPILPYPTYIVTQPGCKQNYFPEIRNINQAPKHFRKKIKKIKKREAVLLAKTTTYSERIQNHNLTESLDYLRRKGRDNKALKKLCSEKNFYLKLLEDLKNPPLQGDDEQ